jgi:ABC-type amino acid transport substrate-binding protein
MKRPCLRSFFAVFGLFLGLALHVAPAVADEPRVFPDIQRVLDAGVLRVALLARDAAPMIMTDDAGTPVGHEPDLARDVGRKLGVAVEFVRTADTYDGVVDVVARKEADIAISYLTGGVRRAQYVYFSRPYVKQSGRLFYNRALFAQLRRDYDIEDVGGIENIPVASDMQVGLVGGSVYETILERDFERSLVRKFNDLNDMMAAVRRGEIFGGLHGSLEVNYYMRQNPSTAIYVAVDQNIRKPSDIRVAVRTDAPNLLRWIDLYLENHVGMLTDIEVIQRYLDVHEAEE